MKRKLLSYIVVMLLGTVSGIAQENNNTVIWGLKASIDAELPSKWHNDGGSVDMFRPGYGFTIGGVSNIYLGKNFYFEPGVSLSYSQYKYKDLIVLNGHGQEVDKDPKIYKWGVQVPLVFGYAIDTERFAMNVFTGPQLRYAFAGDVVVKDEAVQNEHDWDLWNGQRRFDLSWKIGIGFPINNFMVSLEADLGITDLLKADMSFRENRVGLGVTYYF